MKNRQIRSALDGVVLILSAVLFTLLALVSCKSELKSGASPVLPPPAGRSAVAQPSELPPSAVADMSAPKVQGGVEGGVVAGIVGGRGVYENITVTGGAPKPATVSAMAANVDATQFNTEEYGRIQENELLSVADNPLSTFSVDVDRAAYSNVRRFLRDGQRPPRDAVRIEEMVNYFTYDYPDPSGAQPFSVTTEVAACPWNERHRILLVGLQGRRMKTADLPANNLTFLIDVSGSMMEPDKLPLVKEGLELLVNQLRPKDRVAIVVYAGNAGLVLPSTPGSDKGTILSAIQSLEAGGSTAGGAGIKLAYEVAKQNFIDGGNNRVILATDGDFNVGASTDGELEQLIESKRADRIFLTVLGFGTGNIKDSKMELLADKGNGNYAYVDTLAEARKVLVSEMGATLFTIAKDVKLQIEFNPTKVASYRLIGYENRLLRKEDFNNDAKDAGDIGAGHSVTALYELVMPGDDSLTGSVDPLKYQSTKVTAASPELLTLKLRYKEPEGDTSKLLTYTVNDNHADVTAASDNLRFASSVAEFGMLLRDSKFKGDATYDEVRTLAHKSLGRDFEGYRHDFLTMITDAQNLSHETVAASR
ncbi:MAG TPA: VWA domain-containing protein [Thermoanaerobaculia bacterium]|jgi:Ca-activated chloride channel family protein|nr:VWA domain-containing protein [Thermoanaerobaculia bacterium]